MSVEIAIPFALNPDGTIASVQDPNRQALQHVQSLVSTQPGERVMLIDYGVPLGKYLFDPNNDLLNSQLFTDVNDAMQTWEPSILVKTVQPIPDGNEFGISSVQVQYESQSVSSSPIPNSGFSTAIIHVGGEVVEVPN